MNEPLSDIYLYSTQGESQVESHLSDMPCAIKIGQDDSRQENSKKAFSSSSLHIHCFLLSPGAALFNPGLATRFFQESYGRQVIQTQSHLCLHKPRSHVPSTKQRAKSSVEQTRDHWGCRREA